MQLNIRLKIGRLGIFAVFASLLLLSFQNCGDQPASKKNLAKTTSLVSGSSSLASSTATSTVSTPSNVILPVSASSSTANVTRDTSTAGLPFSSGTPGGLGSRSTGGTNTTQAGVVNTGCGQATNDFCFHQDLGNLDIVLHPNGAFMDLGSGSISVNVVSRYPVTYRWYHDNVQFTSSVGGTVTINGGYVSFTAYDYSLAGTYYVVVTETSSNRQITSKHATVSVSDDSAFPCPGGTYYASPVDPMNFGLPRQNRFSNSKGQWLMYAGYFSSIFNSPLRPANSRNFTLDQAAFGAVLTLPSIACSTYVPNINTDPRTDLAPNCTRDPDTGQCATGIGQWDPNGSIVFKCQANKWLMVSNSCRWIDTPVVQ